MTKEELYQSLDYVNHTRERRQQLANLILAHPQLIGSLIEIAFALEHPVSSKACWVLEFTIKERLSYIYPHLNTFVNSLGTLKLDSSVRPVAKICECLMLCYFSKQKNACQELISETHLEKITTACFDWLIGNYKVAAKAYSMTSLLLLGRKFEWIHEELRLILEQNYTDGSAAYKARARHTLAKLKK